MGMSVWDLGEYLEDICRMGLVLTVEMVDDAPRMTLSSKEEDISVFLGLDFTVNHFPMLLRLYLIEARRGMERLKKGAVE